MNWNTFGTRSLSAIVYAAIMLTGLLLKNPWAILILSLLIQFLCSKEFFQLAKIKFPDQHYPLWHFILSVILCALMTVMILAKEMVFLLVFIAVPLIYFLQNVLSRKNVFSSSIVSLLNIFYVGLPLALLVDIRNMDMILPIGIIVLIWINDTMAYIVGSFIGKTPFSPISPKKTWEGTIGGIVLTIGAGLAFGYFGNHIYQSFHWGILAGIVAIFGTLGDLLESKMKRTAGVKDSGNIMPGHGGALDRFDSVLAVLPFAYIYIQLFMIDGIRL